MSDVPVALFVRHAERPELPPDERGHGVELTRAGIAAAEALGRSLAGELCSVRTSPICRCVQTAEAIAGGAFADLAPVEDPALGNPGAFVADVALCWSEWRRLGHDGVMSRLVSGSDEVPGLHPIRTTARALAASALAGIDGHVGTHVFVTHDVVLSPLLVGLLDRGLARDEWPDFLESLTLHREAGRVVVRYRGVSSIIDLE